MTEPVRPPDKPIRRELSECGPQRDYTAMEYHPLAALYPLIEGAAFDRLCDDIRQNGLRVPIVTYQGKILDGRNRHRACIKVGHRFRPEDFTVLPAGTDPKAFVSSANSHRRQLDTEGRRTLIMNLIEANPEGTSNRAIARLAGCDDKTVGTVRKDMEKAVEALSDSWEKLTQRQRQEFVAGKRSEFVELMRPTT